MTEEGAQASGEYLWSRKHPEKKNNPLASPVLVVIKPTDEGSYQLPA